MSGHSQGEQSSVGHPLTYEPRPLRQTQGYDDPMRLVHYFPRYSQRENVVTNNTLLLLLRLMDFSKLRFEEFLGRLAGDADILFSPGWLRIGQQETTGVSIVDGFIAQDSVKIVVETKMHSTFKADQLKRHLSAFQNEDHKLFILLCPSTPSLRGLEQFRAEASDLGVEVLPTTFENIIQVMREVLQPRDEEMLELLKDYEGFCSSTGVLPDDKYFIFTPPCAPSIHDNMRLRLYYCPADRGGRNAKYLGVYANKEVRAIGRIAKVVGCDIDITQGRVSTPDGIVLTHEEQLRVLEATRLAPTHGWDITKDHKFFLCDEWAETSYRKATPGGIQGHRMLDLRKEFGAAIPASLATLAQQLQGRSWT